MSRRLVAPHIDAVPPSGIRKFFDVASEMKDCISLGVGEPDFVTPWNIRDAAIYSIDRGQTHYTSNWGIPELRDAICDYLRVRGELSYSRKQTLVTVGASEALDLAFRACVTPGDEVLVPAPSYVSYLPSVAFAHGVPVPIAVRECDRFKITREQLEAAITDRTRVIILPFPNNPTGAIMTREDYQKIAPVIARHDLFVISDEIYSELTYAGDHFSPAALPELYERTVVINGFSKAFAMTGWRLGYAAGPEDIVAAMCKIHQYTMLCAPIMSQYAGLEALRSEMEHDFAAVREMVREYNRRRMLIVSGFNDMGLPCYEPLGAFYAFPNISKYGRTSVEFCEELLYKKRVACVPGSAFGDAGEGFMRCSYASSVDNIKEALSRIKEFLNEIG